MRKSKELILIITLLVFVASCCKDHSELIPDAPEVVPELNPVNEDGLTTDITDLVPQDVLDRMEELNIPINGGNTPPMLEGTYLASPFVLDTSNIVGDPIGNQFSDYTITFSDLNYETLKLEVLEEALNTGNTGTGLGGFIVGEGCQFSVFVEIITDADGLLLSTVNVISGCVVENGIEDLYYSLFMIDDAGDPNEEYIAIGDGRGIRDADGFSEKIE